MTTTTESDLFSNPVTRAVADMEGRLKAVDPAKIASLEDAGSLDMADWLALGDMASRAMLAGIVDQNTAQTIHALHTDFNCGASLAQRLIFVQVSGEIMSALIARGG